jgi:hypothetical protein
MVVRDGEVSFVARQGNRGVTGAVGRAHYLDMDIIVRVGVEIFLDGTDPCVHDKLWEEQESNKRNLP